MAKIFQIAFAVFLTFAPTAQANPLSKCYSALSEMARSPDFAQTAQSTRHDVMHVMKWDGIQRLRLFKPVLFISQSKVTKASSKAIRSSSRVAILAT